MPSTVKSAPRPSRPKSVRQSVTLPAPLARDVRRYAREHRLTLSRALVALSERGVRAELESKRALRDNYLKFMREQDPAAKEAAGKDLMRAVFGSEAIAEDPLR